MPADVSSWLSVQTPPTLHLPAGPWRLNPLPRPGEAVGAHVRRVCPAPRKTTLCRWQLVGETASGQQPRATAAPCVSRLPFLALTLPGLTRDGVAMVCKVFMGLPPMLLDASCSCPATGWVQPHTLGSSHVAGKLAGGGESPWPGAKG